MNRLLRNLKGEEGATVVLVAICAVVLMGAVALAVDVGGLLYRRREMVNGADSAALAAAIACSKGESPESQADGHFLGNAPAAVPGDVGGTNITQLVGCGQPSGHVVVNYTTQQPLYFAPVLGLADHHAVSTTATASWGQAGPFPISVNLGPANAFHTCSINALPGDDCYYLFDNNANGNGDFGFLNLAQWSWQSDQGCNAAGGANLIGGEITGAVGYSQYAFKIPDYVCQVGGLKGPDWSQALASLKGKDRWFPINDPTKQTQKRWYIVGFAQMTILDVNANMKKNESCGGLIAKNASNVCVHLKWVSGGVGTGPHQLETVILCDLTYKSCLDQ
jgi:Flp pilus assembly protein TadG